MVKIMKKMVMAATKMVVAIMSTMMKKMVKMRTLVTKTTMPAMVMTKMAKTEKIAMTKVIRCHLPWSKPFLGFWFFQTQNYGHTFL